jgi:hypothetical protein
MLNGEDQTLKRPCASTCGLNSLFVISQPALALHGSLTFWLVFGAAAWDNTIGGVVCDGVVRRSVGGKESGGSV